MVAAYVTSLGAGWALTRRWSSRAPEHLPQNTAIPTEELELVTSDGCKVRAWLFAPDAPGSTLVLLHGWRGSRSTMLERAAALTRAGHAVLAPTLRAHGDAEGSRYDFGATAWRDVEACVAAVEQRRPGKKLVLVGCSYGAVVALECAIRAPRSIDGLVLDSLFADMESAIRRRCELFLPPVVEDLAALGLFAAAPLVFPEMRDITPAVRCESLDPAIPVLLVRCGRDDRVSGDETTRIAQALGARSETLVLERAEHDRSFESDGERWIEAIRSFTERAEPRD